MKHLLFKFILIISFSLNSFAVELKVGDFALKCSGVFLLMTMPEAEEWQAFTDNMGDLSNLMSVIGSTAYEMNNINLNYGQTIEKRNIEADKVINSYKNDAASTIQLYANCDKFREDFAYVAMKYPNSDEKVLNTLSIPKDVYMSPQKTGLIEMVFEMSFKEMEEAGIDSIVELYKSIR